MSVKETLKKTISTLNRQFSDDPTNEAAQGISTYVYWGCNTFSISILKLIQIKLTINAFCFL